MLNKIIQFALKNRLLVLLSAILIIIAGFWAIQTTEVDVFPDLNAPTVVIMTEAGGLAPEEVEKTVTFPIETAVNGASDVRRVRSSSTTGFSVVWVEFDWGTDIYIARQIVSEKLAAVKDQLPANVGSPTMGPQSSILGEILIIGLTSDTQSLEQLRTIADWTIRPSLLSTGGVAQVAVIGGDAKEFQILLNFDKMQHYGVSLAEVLAAAEDMNRNASGGVIYEYSSEYIVRGMAATADIEEIGNNVIKLDQSGNAIKFSDIAKIKTGAQLPRIGTASVQGEKGVILTVTKQAKTSTKELSAQLDHKLSEISASLPSDIVFHTDIFRQETFIDSSINNIKNALIEGAFFVIIVLFLFLMNVRITLISLVSIPISLLISLIVLRLTGLSINTMSIGGMAIAIGSLVDDAIVDVDNVYKRLKEKRTKPRLEVVYQASKEVRKPILNSTIIIIVSFIPLFFLDGIEGRMLIPLGIAFIVSLFASTATALTLTPVLCSYLLNDKSKEKGEPKFTLALKKAYSKLLERAIKQRKLVISSAAVLLIASIIILCSFGQNFLPPFNEGSFTINVSTLPGVSLEESDKIGRKAEQLILSVPEIKTVARKTGRAELDEHALGVNTSEIEAPFSLGERSKNQVVTELREKLSHLPGVNIEIGQPISHRIDAMLSGTQAAIAIKIFGNNLNTLFDLGNDIKDAVSGIEGIADLNVEQQIERPELKIVPKREMMAAYGISMSEFSEYIEVCMGGLNVGNVYEDAMVFPLTIQADSLYRSSAEGIRNMLIDSPKGKIQLETIAEIVSSSGPNTINRENAIRKIVVSANVTGSDLQGVVNKMKAEINERVNLPEGYHIEFSGQFESAQKATKILILLSFLALIVVFFLLYKQFGSLSQAGFVLLDLPLALIGGVIILWLGDQTVSIPALIGFISLFGIATRNGMLLIDRYNTLRNEGLSTLEAVLQGSVDRLNPILMTALTSALALIPLALGGDLPGNEIQSPMAKVILGGLLSSTLLNAFVIPIVYLLSENK